MASDINLVIRDGSDNPITTGNFDLRTSPFSSAGVAGSHVAGGNWLFDNVANGTYRLFNTTSGVYAGWGGDTGHTIFDGVVNPSMIVTGTVPAAQVVTFTASPIVPTAASTGQAVPYEQAVRTSGNQLGIAGIKEFNDLVDFNTIPTLNKGYSDFSQAIELVNKGYSDTAISNAINNLPQSTVMSAYERWVISGVTEIPNKVYNTILAAVNNILAVATPSATARYKVIVRDSTATGYVACPHTAIKDYIDIQAGAPEINLIIGGTGESLTHTKTMTIKGFNPIFGNGVLVGARVYNNISWIDCNVDAYNDFTIGGTGKSIGTNWRSGTGNTPTITGTVELADSDFTQAITFTTYTGKIKRSVTDESDTGITMPTDVTVGA